MIKYLIIYATLLLNHRYKCSHDDLVLKFPVSAFFFLWFLFLVTHSVYMIVKTHFCFLYFVWNLEKILD